MVDNIWKRTYTISIKYIKRRTSVLWITNTPWWDMGCQGLVKFQVEWHTHSVMPLKWNSNSPTVSTPFLPARPTICLYVRISRIRPLKIGVRIITRRAGKFTPDERVEVAAKTRIWPWRKALSMISLSSKVRPKKSYNNIHRWSLNNIGVTGTDPTHSEQSVYNFWLPPNSSCWLKALLIIQSINTYFLYVICII